MVDLSFQELNTHITYLGKCKITGPSWLPQWLIKSLLAFQVGTMGFLS